MRRRWGLMAGELSGQTRRASKDALKTIYRFIVALAITEALKQTFFPANVFLGWQAILSPANRPSTILFCAFLPTVIRFVHGASIHLDKPSSSRYKPFVDFVTFSVQGILFYLMALSLGHPINFMLLFAALLFSGASWLLIGWRTGYIE